MKTTSEMREDFYGPQKSKQAVVCTWLIPQGSVVRIADENHVMREYVTKQQNVFLEQHRMDDSVKAERTWLYKGKIPGLSDTKPVAVTVRELSKEGYYVFKTDNARWPFMVVYRQRALCGKTFRGQ